MMLRLVLFFVILQVSSESVLKEFNEEKFLINTEKCKIPDITVQTPNITRVLKNYPISCTEYNPLLSYTKVKDKRAWLYVRNETLVKYFGVDHDIKCCYGYVFRNGSVSQPDVGISVTNCYLFDHYVELKHDIVWISCARNEYFQYARSGYPRISVYENIHQVVRVKSEVAEKARMLKESVTKKPISILMLVIDSVSRLNFIRTMPKTRNFILNNGFFEFLVYNKVDLNTYPNAMALLTGLNPSQSSRICKPRDIDGLMNCPFIWYKYANLGYATAYAEDWSQIATFNYLKAGFRDSPSDYYFKPYMDAITYLKTRFQDTMPFCAGPESQGDRILNIAYDFATTHKDLPSFGVFWANTFSHNDIHTPRTMDQKVKSFFKKIRISGILDESIVILLSDHGVRYGDLIGTARMFYEERLPMNYISLPKWFKEAYPVETNHFLENTKKLTSTYDMFMTLQHVLALSGVNYTVTKSTACPECRSLFKDISLNRGCEEAGIDEEWCSCNGLPKNYTDYY